MRATGLALAVAACASKKPAQPKTSIALPRTPLEGGATIADASHLLARLSFGARPGEPSAVLAGGLAPWLDRQLRPSTIVDKAGVDALAPFASALKNPDELRADEEDAQRETTKGMAKREHVLETQMTALARHFASERQVLEVMTDFWTNHFSVSLQKGRVRYLAADFVEKTIRPHALGKFSAMLLATARHPAMLIYLDNAQSVAPKPGTRPAMKGRGLNENYARELLELHTVGVAAGYTQDDVLAVARILSGWSVVDDEFVFRSRVHDDGIKTVMGKTFAQGRGEPEGVELLEYLASHPATIAHVCKRLCARLVADDPPPDVIAAASAAWTKTGGEIAAVVRAIVAEPAFWAASVRGTKLKSPLELVVGSLRAVGATVDGVGPARMLARLGQPLFAAPAPTGYADASSAWLSTAATLERMELALALAAKRIPGVQIPNDASLDDRLAPETRAVIERRTRGIPSMEQRRVLALALALASPEMQYQ
jgi:uncharacterized protein (DUF1800 family)